LRRKSNMKELHNEIEIRASAEKVWQVLTNLEKYHEWNPLLHQAVGKVQVGENVDVTFRTSSKEMTLHCTVAKVEPHRELCWKYHVILPVLFRGEHLFTIEPIDGRCVRFIDREIFRGMLVPLQAKDIDENSKPAMVAMDKALRERVEQGKEKT
jgi:hypothetical protein